MKQRFQPRASASGTSVPQKRARGFSLIEAVIAMAILSVGLLGIATMFSTGYSDVASGGQTTVAVGIARQIMEDIRLLPAQSAFMNVYNLNGVDTTLANMLPTNNPELSIARKFRYLMAGTASQATWGITSTMISAWGAQPNITGTAFGGQGTIGVADVGATANTLAQVTVTVTLPGRPPVVLSSLIGRL